MSDADTIALRCPTCDRALRGAPLYRSATTIHARTCRCGAAWVVRVRPLASTATKSVHEVQWHPKATS